MKDIQLLFSPYEQIPDFYRDHSLLSECTRCYSKPCICENKIIGNPFFVKMADDLKLEKTDKLISYSQDEIWRFEEGLGKQLGGQNFSGGGLSEEEANKIFGIPRQERRANKRLRKLQLRGMKKAPIL